MSHPLNRLRYYLARDPDDLPPKRYVFRRNDPERRKRQIAAMKRALRGVQASRRWLRPSGNTTTPAPDATRRKTGRPLGEVRQCLLCPRIPENGQGGRCAFHSSDWEKRSGKVLW
jgi:hypothetical protein